MWRATGLYSRSDTFYIVHQSSDAPYKFFEPILFADDTNLFVRSKNLNCLSSEINENLDIVFKWCNANKLTFNVAKANIILMKNPQNKF